MSLRRIGFILFLGTLIVCALPALAQTQQAPPPEKVDQLIKLLADPVVKDWLAQQIQTKNPPAGGAPGESGSQAKSPGMEQSSVSIALDRIKQHLKRIAMAWPELPAKFQQTRDILVLEFADRGIIGIALLIAFFVAVGAGFAYLALRLTRPLRLWTIAQPHETPQGRVKKVGSRFLLVLILLGAFMLGSAGTFLMFEWPPLLREIVLAYLTAAIVIWATRMLARFILLPPNLEVVHAREVRVLNVDDEVAAHWYRWIVILVTVFALAAATFSLLPTFGYGADDLLALAVPADLLLLALGLAAVWLRPKPKSNPEPSDDRRGIGHTAVSWLITAYFILLLLIRTSGAFILFWFAVAAVTLPAAIVMAHRAVHYILRVPAAESGARPVPAVTLAVIDRGIRLVLIVLAAILLARAWGLDMHSMDNSNPALAPILRGLLHAIVIVLAADFGWSIIKALIGRRLGLNQAATGDHVLEPQQARLRTLLPIIQNITFAIILIMVILMILSSMGIQIGPLIAGAGVVGVAVGFGAQTVVKDVIAGIFYLLDDAFRVGEYISSGKYMGTVESFSLRSIKLRHHRGPLFTIPFGELGAVQNQSRDWVTDKFNITVGYDTDLDKARKLIKKIGLELAADPEFAPWVIEPIKMQGVKEFGDYGIVLRIKVTTKPGGAFAMKRKFYLQVNKAFKENGIELPLPTVHVQQGEAAAAAIAQNYLATKKKAAETGEEADGG